MNLYTARDGEMILTLQYTKNEIVFKQRRSRHRDEATQKLAAANQLDEPDVQRVQNSIVHTNVYTVRNRNPKHTMRPRCGPNRTTSASSFRQWAFDDMLARGESTEVIDLDTVTNRTTSASSSRQWTFDEMLARSESTEVIDLDTVQPRRGVNRSTNASSSRRLSLDDIFSRSESTEVHFRERNNFNTHSHEAHSPEAIVLPSPRQTEQEYFLQAHKELAICLRVGHDPQFLDIVDFQTHRESIARQPRLCALVALLKLPVARKAFFKNYADRGNTNMLSVAKALHGMLQEYWVLDPVERKHQNQLNMRAQGPSVICSRIGVQPGPELKQANIKVKALESFIHSDLASHVMEAQQAKSWGLQNMKWFVDDLFNVLDRLKPPLLSRTSTSYNRKWYLRLVLFSNGAILRHDEVKGWSDMLGPLVNDDSKNAFPTPLDAVDFMRYSGPLLLFEAMLCTVHAAVKEIRKNNESWEESVSWIIEHRETLRSADQSNHPLQIVKSSYETCRKKRSAHSFDTKNDAVTPFASTSHVSVACRYLCG